MGEMNIDGGSAIPPDLQSLGNIANQDGSQSFSTVDEKTSDLGKMLMEGFPEVEGYEEFGEGFDFSDKDFQIAESDDNDLSKLLEALGGESALTGTGEELALHLGEQSPEEALSTDEPDLAEMEALLKGTEKSNSAPMENIEDMADLLGLSKSDIELGKSISSSIHRLAANDENSISNLLSNIDQVFAKKVGEEKPDIYSLKEVGENPENFTIYGGYNSESRQLFLFDPSERSLFVKNLALHLVKLSEQEKFTTEVKESEKDPSSKLKFNPPTKKNLNAQETNEINENKRAEQKMAAKWEKTKKQQLAKEEEKKWIEKEISKTKQNQLKEKFTTEKRASILKNEIDKHSK